MTDRIRTLVVTLRADVRDDDIEAVRSAIAMLGPVALCDVGPIVDLRAHEARRVAQLELRQRILDLLL